MNTPPLLIGAVLLLWGWQAEWWWLGLILGAAVEAARLTTARWEFTRADLTRLWHFCQVLFGGLLLYLVSSADNGLGRLWQTGPKPNPAQALEQSARSLFQLVQWLPILVLPVMLAQAWGNRDRLPVSAFTFILRWRKGGEAPEDVSEPALNLSYPFFALCLVGASATNRRGLFLWAQVALIGWALWVRRSRRYRAPAWLFAFAGAMVFGAASWLGLREATQWFDRAQARWMQRWMATTGANSRESRTAIGQVGAIKLSSAIALRLETDGQSPPARLREASYSTYRSSVWLNPSRDFLTVNDEGDGLTWKLLPGQAASHSVTIFQPVDRGARLLALPAGTTRLQGEWPLLLIETNSLGAVRISDDLSLAGFTADYHGRTALDLPPFQDDRLVPASEQATMARVANQIGLVEGIAPAEALRRLQRFFLDQFEYGTWFDTGYLARSNRTALSVFLEEKKRGHCEYFATASVLLLRQAGIPARYATGWSVQEGNGRQWIVRARHAHAWALAWVDGAWQDVDNTPGTWSQVERERAGAFVWLQDAWSRLRFEFDKLRYGKTAIREYVLLAIGPVAGLLLWRILARRQWRRAARPGGAGPDVERPGMDSEWYEVARRLARSGRARLDSETNEQWLERLQRSGEVDPSALAPLLEWHNRLRFDPAGLAPAERDTFRAAVSRWLNPVSGRR